MADVFGTNTPTAEAWSLDGAIVKIANGENLLVSSVQIAYQRSQSVMRPLNANKLIVLAGRGSGTVALTVIVGKSDKLGDFLKQYGDPCNINENTMTISSTVKDACNDSANTVFKCGQVLAQGLNVGVQGAEAGSIAMINGSVVFTIGSLSVE